VTRDYKKHKSIFQVDRANAGVNVSLNYKLFFIVWLCSLLILQTDKHL